MLGMHGRCKDLDVAFVPSVGMDGPQKKQNDDPNRNSTKGWPKGRFNLQTSVPMLNWSLCEHTNGHTCLHIKYITLSSSDGAGVLLHWLV